MSELRTDTITGSDGTSPVTLTKQSAAKACGMIDMPNDFTGGANAAYATLNVSSVSDDSTGNTSVSVSSAFLSNTDKCVTTGSVVSNRLTSFNSTSSTASVIKLQATDADTDTEEDQVQTFSATGDLA